MRVEAFDRATLRCIGVFRIQSLAIGHQRSSNTKLQLRFRGTVKLLVHRWIAAVKGGIGPSTVRESLEDDSLGRRDGEEETKLRTPADQLLESFERENDFV